MSKHPYPNGTPVMVETHPGYTATGVVCDHETRDIGGDEPSILYRVAMDWPRGVKGFEKRFVKRLGKGKAA